jgi:hypothetical protein
MRIVRRSFGMIVRDGCALLLVAGLALAGCGGKVYLDPAGAGAAGGGGSSSGSGSGCSDSSECPPNAVCVFDTGTCAPVCEPFGLEAQCGEGLVCNDCATSSCPSCEDCKAACVKAAEGQCDDHDDCPSDSVCLYSSGTCAIACNPATAICPKETKCDSCATSSCPGCDDCLGACVQ